jgi:hypothetical protein
MQPAAGKYLIMQPKVASITLLMPLFVFRPRFYPVHHTVYKGISSLKLFPKVFYNEYGGKCLSLCFHNFEHKNENKFSFSLIVNGFEFLI